MILPQPADPFEWRGAHDRPWLACRALEPFARHLFTTEPWTLGRRQAESRNDGWREVAAAVCVDDEKLIRVHQVHGNDVAVASNVTSLTSADIIVNADPSFAIAVQSADCVPLLLADPDTGAVAVAHAGWRGMVCRVPSKAVAAMASLFGSRPASLRAAIGPSVGACCYEVGPDVRDAFSDAAFDGKDVERWFFDQPQPSSVNPRMPSVAPGPRQRRWFFDGVASVRDQLRAVGVAEGHIWSTGLCTASHGGVFCSYRRDGSPAGRMAAVIVASSHRP